MLKATILSNSAKNLTHILQRLKTIRINPRVFVFLFFLLIATIFWFLDALSKDYTTTVTYPVDYRNFPENKILVGDLPGHLKVQINGYGFTLLQIKMGMAIDPMPFDIQEMSLTPKAGNHGRTYFYLTELAQETIAEKLPSGVSVMSVKPDSIIFRFEDVDSKDVPVAKEAFTFRFRKQYMQTGPLRITPDSVKIWGPEARLDTIRHVRPAKKLFTDLNKDLAVEVPLEEKTDIRIKPPKVRLRMEVSEFTEKTVKLPVEIRNLPRGTNVKLFPDNVRVTFHVGLQQYAGVSESRFRAVVNYDDIRSGISNKVRVRLATRPGYIQDVRIYPEYLEYILEQ